MSRGGKKEENAIKKIPFYRRSTRTRGTRCIELVTRSVHRLINYLMHFVRIDTDPMCRVYRNVLQLTLNRIVLKIKRATIHGFLLIYKRGNLLWLGVSGKLYVRLESSPRGFDKRAERTIRSRNVTCLDRDTRDPFHVYRY